MKLDGDLFNLLALALMCKPGMVQVRANQRQFQVFNHLNMPANYAFRPLCIQDQVQFIFVMIMKGKIKLVLNPRKNSKAITWCKGCNFTHYVACHYSINLVYKKINLLIRI